MLGCWLIGRLIDCTDYECSRIDFDKTPYPFNSVNLQVLKPFNRNIFTNIDGDTPSISVSMSCQWIVKEVEGKKRGVYLVVEFSLGEAKYVDVVGRGKILKLVKSAARRDGVDVYLRDGDVFISLR